MRKLTIHQTSINEKWNVILAQQIEVEISARWKLLEHALQKSLCAEREMKRKHTKFNIKYKYTLAKSVKEAETKRNAITPYEIIRKFLPRAQ